MIRVIESARYDKITAMNDPHKKSNKEEIWTSESMKWFTAE